MTSTQTLTTPEQQLYDTDFIEWVNHTAELLKQRRFDAIDLENLIDEVETLGRSEKRALESNLRVVILHLLKWEYQPEQRSGSWESSIREHRRRINESLRDSPSLRNYYKSVITDNYPTARANAASETGLPIEIFPSGCQYTDEQLLSKDFWPEDDTNR